MFIDQSRWQRLHTFGPLIEDMLCYVPRRVRRVEEKFFRFAADKDQAQINLKSERDDMKISR